MMYKSTLISRQWWAKFSLALQDKNILGTDGRTMNKREVFEQLYTEGSDSQVSIELLLAGIHDTYTLCERDGYYHAIAEKQLIEENTLDELRKQAVILARGLEIDNFDQTIAAMVKAMGYVLDNSITINKAIAERVKKSGSSAAQ